MDELVFNQLIRKEDIFAPVQQSCNTLLVAHQLAPQRRQWCLARLIRSEPTRQIEAAVDSKNGRSAPPDLAHSLSLTGPRGPLYA